MHRVRSLVPMAFSAPPRRGRKKNAWLQEPCNSGRVHAGGMDAANFGRVMASSPIRISNMATRAMAKPRTSHARRCFFAWRIALRFSWDGSGRALPGFLWSFMQVPLSAGAAVPAPAGPRGPCRFFKYKIREVHGEIRDARRSPSKHRPRRSRRGERQAAVRPPAASQGFNVRQASRGLRPARGRSRSCRQRGRRAEKDRVPIFESGREGIAPRVALPALLPGGVVVHGQGGR